MSKRIHILHVVSTLAVGGIELVMAKLIHHLPSDEMRHSICCLKGDAIIRDRLDGVVDVHCMRSESSGRFLPIRLAKLLRQIRPDVIHARNWGAWPDIAIAARLVRPSIPLIWSFHGLDYAGPIPLRRRLACRLLATITARIFTVSQAAKDVLVQSIGLPAGRIDVIPNGVDMAWFSACPRRLLEGILTIGTVGNLRAVKNQSLLLQAAALLRERGVGFRLAIAGEGPERQPLLNLARQLGIQDQVSLVGHIPDVPRFLQSLDVFVLSSKSEAHPNALLEAMAAKLPCVATAVGGCVEVLDQGRCGILVPSGDAAAMAEAIAKFAESPCCREELAAAGFARVHDLYSLDRMAECYQRLYCMVAGVARKSTKEEEATMNKVRVVMLAPLPPPAGGMATVALNLMNSRLARDCELTVVDTAKRTPEGRGQLRGFLYQLRLLMGIASAVRRTRAQIVHIHTCSGFTFWRDSIHLILARMMRRQAVWHIHGAQFDTFVNNFSCIEKMAYRAVLGMAGVVIVLSDDWLARLQSSAPRARWRALPNGTPLQVGVRSRFNDKPVFLFLANLEPRKGAGDLIQAFALAKKRVYTGMLEVVGGETLPGQKTELENLASDLKCLSEIRFRGLLQGVEKDRTLAQADCFVLPSYAEGLPMAMLEAMACGLPVIATTVGGIPEVITDGKEGFLVAPGDIGALADRMIKLARDISLRQLMGQNALDRVVREFSLDKMCDRILDIYQDVLGDPHERDSHDLTHTPSTGDD